MEREERIARTFPKGVESEKSMRRDLAVLLLLTSAEKADMEFGSSKSISFSSIDVNSEKASIALCVKRRKHASVEAFLEIKGWGRIVRSSVETRDVQIAERESRRTYETQPPTQEKNSEQCRRLQYEISDLFSILLKMIFESSSPPINDHLKELFVFTYSC